MAALQNNTRYLFALEPPLATASKIQKLLDTSTPPSAVAGRDADGETVSFALLPLSAIEPITRALYPSPPTFKPVTLAPKTNNLPTLGTGTTPLQHRPASESGNAFLVPDFFYGTLADPHTLQNKLNLVDEPGLKAASIQRGQLRMWGPYRALVDGLAGDVVQGRVFVVQSEEQEELLRFYETGAYEAVKCEIAMEGRVVRGRTFRWAGGVEKLEACA